MRKTAYRLIEATHEQFTLNNININSKIMADSPGITERIIKRIGELKEQKDMSELFMKSLDMEDEKELKIFLKEGNEAYRAEILIDGLTKILNNEN